MDDVLAKVDLTGQLVGACEGASETRDWMETELEVVQRAAEGQESPQALYVFYGTTPGPNTFISDIITNAGAENVAADADLEYSQAGYARMNPEVVANLTVEWLLLNSGQPQVPDSPAYRNTIAVQENQTLVLNSTYVSQPAPRSIYVMRNLSQAWYPEAYAEANASVRGDASTGTTTTSGGATATATATDGGETDADMPTEEPESDDGGSPGFGVVAALVAALSLAGVARQT
jgi:iron complex transport system substrate-binding protein